MIRNTSLKILLGAVIVIAALGVLRFKPWQRASSTRTTETAEAIATLNVGYLPVTCHLTCPVTDFATRTSKETRFDSQRFTDFPTVVETMKSGRLDATFMIAPLAMKLREQGLPVKILYLGHRDGSTVMVQKDSPAKSLRDLRGKTFAIPSKYSNQNLVIHKLMEDQGVKPDEIRFVEMPPPDMPGALASKAIDAYFVGEPHAARAELDGSGRVLYHAKDIWPQFISCVLVATEKLIKEKPEVVRDLVRGIAESGEWAETHRLEAAKVAAPYFRQDEKVVRYVLTQPPDRVSYRMLTPTDEDLGKIHEMGLKAGILEKRIEMKDLVDRSFIPADIKAANIQVK
ncbi:MAG TPA: ABC transporter substrate-binding protein [Blastocatellia bacterium]|nr:ABC transporter substrate-binding protein [Blastocatellia bacterium]HMV84312.1 ABC transporter substrate-binding protein [Blastocatellia bacterium]HMX30460.1 ABC transporter substrate-binding protein [Blastocatellia bacterium]HMZ21340.1 ABC transporter substrate-binding protein [Blastocatellia bacterium]HNG34536.1 ABC transporter substrate-binding protein [Blastocatellia bacterium]